MSRTRARRRTRGQTLVEFAMVIPIFLLLLFAVIDFGVMLFSRMTVTNAAREGARVVLAYASEEADLADGIVSGAQYATSAQSFGLLEPGDVTVTCQQSKGEPVAADCHDATPRNLVTVRANYTYHPLTPLISPFFSSGVDLGATVQMVLE